MYTFFALCGWLLVLWWYCFSPSARFAFPSGAQKHKQTSNLYRCGSAMCCKRFSFALHTPAHTYIINLKQKTSSLDALQASSGNAQNNQ